MKKSFRGYNRKETDQYIEQLKADYEATIDSLRAEISNLNSEIEVYKLKIAELENDNKAVSNILVDAVKHAQQIELEYKNRARQSDEHYSKMANEWENRIMACRDSITDMKNAAKATYDDLIRRIDQFENWSLDNLSSATLLEISESVETKTSKDTTDDITTVEADDISSDNLQSQILTEVNADLSQACKELGITEESKND